MSTTRDALGASWTPVEYDDELTETRCLDCGHPASYPGVRQDWCIICAQPVHEHPTGKDIEYRTRLENRFWEKVNILEPDECWPWKKYVGTEGYGRIKIDGRSVRAHRVALMLEFDLSSVDELQGEDVRHKCDNKACVNTRHLTTGTHSENIIDAILRGGIEVRFEPKEIREIRRLADETEKTQSEIGSEFGASQRMISSIARGERYAWVE